MLNDDPELRELWNDDAEALHRFYCNLSPETLRMFHPMGHLRSLPFCLRLCEEHMQGDSYHVVLEHNQTLVGWAFLSRMDNEEVELGVGLADGWQGRGQGRRLIRALVRHARNIGKHSVDLTVLADNQRARRLYEDMGFTALNTFETAGGERYQRMRLPLRTSKPARILVSA